MLDGSNSTLSQKLKLFSAKTVSLNLLNFFLLERKVKIEIKLFLINRNNTHKEIYIGIFFDSKSNSK
jgi:hypothetical protein